MQHEQSAMTSMLSFLGRMSPSSRLSGATACVLTQQLQLVQPCWC
jgi:hypothetical protein